jgi:hypothetical protein
MTLALPRALKMVVGGKHGLARKPRVLVIMCIFLGLFILSSLLLTLSSVSRRRHSTRLLDSSNFASGGTLLTLSQAWCTWVNF